MYLSDFIWVGYLSNIKLPAFITGIKVQLFWKSNKNLKKYPSCIDKSADLLSKRQKEDFFQIMCASQKVRTLILNENTF